jgi:hypothetical protein
VTPESGTLAQAIEVAEVGDVVKVAAGEYEESITTTGKANLTIQGAKANIPAGPNPETDDRGVGESIIKGTVTLAGANNVLDGFTVDSGTNHGIVIANSGSGAVIKNNILLGEKASSGTQAGVYSESLNNATIVNNSIIGYQYGTWADGSNVPPSTVSYNYISGTNYGIFFQGSNPDGQTIEYNVFENNGTGIMVAQGGHSIAYNAIRGSTGAAIRLWGTARTSNNSIVDNTLENNKIAIWLSNNNAGAVDNFAHYNKIVGNETGVKNDHDAVFDARYNWWGTADLAEIEAKISGNVDFNPWYVNEEMNKLCDEAAVEAINAATRAGMQEALETNAVALRLDITAYNKLSSIGQVRVSWAVYR